MDAESSAFTKKSNVIHMISAIILTWNSERYIEGCILQLVKSSKNATKELEILIVDNGSSDATKKIIEKLQKTIPTIILISYPNNVGTTISRNSALKKAKGEYILILDSDVELEDGALGELCTFLDTAPQVGMVSPRLLYGDRTLQYSYKKFPTIILKIMKALHRYTGIGKKYIEKNELYSEKNEIIYPDYTISACWLIRKNMITSVGLLDENIFYAPEDVDFCLRIWLAGYFVAYTTKAIGIHFTQRISYTKMTIAFSHLKGLFYYFKKHHYFFSKRSIYHAIAKVLHASYPISK